MCKSEQLWNNVDHCDSEQIKRQKSACGKKLTPVSMDSENQSGVFEGSSKDYTVTLERCDCVDFSRRKLPCKHMYRLAHELKVFDLSNAGSISGGLLKRDVPYTVDEIITQLPESEARHLKYFLNRIIIQHGDTVERWDASIPVGTLIHLEIIREIPETPQSAVVFFKADELKEYLKCREVPVPTSRKRAIIEPLAIEHVPDLLLDNLHTSTKRYEFNPLFEPIWSSLYTKLTKEYPGETHSFEPETGLYYSGIH